LFFSWVAWFRSKVYYSIAAAGQKGGSIKPYLSATTKRLSRLIRPPDSLSISAAVPAQAFFKAMRARLRLPAEDWMGLRCRKRILRKPFFSRMERMVRGE
jgi:hypothetical protein